MMEEGLEDVSVSSASPGENVADCSVSSVSQVEPVPTDVEVPNISTRSNEWERLGARPRDRPPVKMAPLAPSLVDLVPQEVAGPVTHGVANAFLARHSQDKGVHESLYQGSMSKDTSLQGASYVDGMMSLSKLNKAKPYVGECQANVHSRLQFLLPPVPEGGYDGSNAAGGYSSNAQTEIGPGPSISYLTDSYHLGNGTVSPNSAFNSSVNSSLRSAFPLGTDRPSGMGHFDREPHLPLNEQGGLGLYTSVPMSQRFHSEMTGSYFGNGSLMGTAEPPLPPHMASERVKTQTALTANSGLGNQSSITANSDYLPSALTRNVVRVDVQLGSAGLPPLAVARSNGADVRHESEAETSRTSQYELGTLKSNALDTSGGLSVASVNRDIYNRQIEAGLPSDDSILSFGFGLLNRGHQLTPPVHGTQTETYSALITNASRMASQCEKTKTNLTANSGIVNLSSAVANNDYLLSASTGNIAEVDVHSESAGLLAPYTAARSNGADNRHESEDESPRTNQCALGTARSNTFNTSGDWAVEASWPSENSRVSRLVASANADASFEPQGTEASLLSAYTGSSLLNRDFGTGPGESTDNSLLALEQRVEEACALVERVLREREEREEVGREIARKEREIREQRAREAKRREREARELEEASRWPQEQEAITGRSQWLCEHYQRHCRVRFPCCSHFYSCHRCHNNSKACDNEEAKASHATHLKCSFCQHEQEIGEASGKCFSCGAQMSAYFCSICKHFTSVDENPYHCKKCGICRIHKDKSFYCEGCNTPSDRQKESEIAPLNSTDISIESLDSNTNCDGPEFRRRVARGRSFIKESERREMAESGSSEEVIRWFCTCPAPPPRDTSLEEDGICSWCFKHRYLGPSSSSRLDEHCKEHTALPESPRWQCEHYQRLCRVKFPCCGRFYPCHRCHNNSDECVNDDCEAKEAFYLECSVCRHQQAINQDAQTCARCKTKMSAYFCSICKHFTAEDKYPFHCKKCGICRIHKDRSLHCDVCNVCLDKQLQEKLKYRPNSGHDECCICLKDVFSGCQILPCSHKVHRECAIAMIQNGVRSCPICRHPLYSQTGGTE